MFLCHNYTYIHTYTYTTVWNNKGIQAELQAATQDDDEDQQYESVDIHQACHYGVTSARCKQPQFKEHRSRTAEEGLSMPTTAERLCGIVRFHKVEREHHHHARLDSASARLPSSPS
jgi:hypothetical protein